MAEFRITVIVDPTQAERGNRRVRNQLGRTQSAADRLQASIQRALAFVGVAAGIRELQRLADAYTNLTNRLRTVARDQEAFGVAFEDTFRIAQETRRPLEDVADLYARIGLASRELGLAQAELADLTQSVSQAVQLSGSTTAEASGALRQFGQSLSSGIVRAEEFNSVIEGAPRLALALADGLNVTTGELRRLVVEGALPSERALRALQSQEEVLAREFAALAPTIDGALTVLRNGVLRAVGELDQATGASITFARTIIALTDSADTLVRSMLAASFTLGTVFAARALPTAIAGVRTLTLAIAANPFGALAVAITATASALVAFSDRIGISRDGVVTLADLATAAFRDITGAVRTTADVIDGDLRDSIDNAREDLDAFGNEIPSTFESLLLRIGRFADLASLIGQVLGTALTAPILDGIVDAEDRLRDFVGLSALDREGRLTADQQIQQLIEQANAVGPIARRIASLLAAARTAAESRLAGPAGPDLPERAPAAAPDPVGGLIESLTREAELLQLSNREREVRTQLLALEEDLNRELTAGERGRLRPLIETNLALAEQNALLDDLQNPVDALIQRQQTLNQLYRAGRVDIETYANETIRLQQSIRDLGTNIGAQLSRVFQNIGDQAQRASELTAEFIGRTFERLGDLAGEAAAEGFLRLGAAITGIERETRDLREVFLGFTESALQAVLRLTARLLVAAAITAILRGVSGNVSLPTAGLAGGLEGFQNGGEFEVGGSGGPDSQLVAFRASPREIVSVQTPAQARRSEDDRPIIVQGPPVQVVVTTSEQQLQDRVLTGPRAEQLVVDLIARNPNAIRGFGPS